MPSVKELIDSYALRGYVTKSEHSALIQQIQQNGLVTPEDSVQLTRIFQLSADGKLQIVDDSVRREQASPKPFSKVSKDYVAGSWPTLTKVEDGGAIPDFTYPALELENDRVLKISLDASVWIKPNSAIAYSGEIDLLKDSQGFTKAEGRGELYLAESQKRISLFEISGETVFLKQNCILALGQSIAWEFRSFEELSSVTTLSSSLLTTASVGTVAVATEFEPVRIDVAANKPIVAKAAATAAWSGSLTLAVLSDEELQLSGEGFVLLEP